MSSFLRFLSGQNFPLLGIGLMLLGLLHIVVRTSGAVSGAVQFHAEVEALTSRVLAEELAKWLVDQNDTEPREHVIRHRAGFDLVAAVSSAGRGDRLQIDVTSPVGRTFSYAAELLEGASPYALGRPLSISRGALAGSSGPWDWIWKMPIPEPVWLPMNDFPEILPEARNRHESRPELTGMRVDHGIALLYLRSGTDLPDFVLSAGRSGRIEKRTRGSSWVGVDGNLWLAHGEESVSLDLNHDLTIIVHGNIYLGSSLRVRGPGRLTLVALSSPPSCYRDRDMDGGFSSQDEILPADGSPYGGWVEGSGGVYLGLPGSVGPPPRLLIEGSVVAEGEIYLRTPLASIGGALVIGTGLTRASEQCELRILGKHLPQTDRERVPGFAFDGTPRPGLLQLVR